MRDSIKNYHEAVAFLESLSNLSASGRPARHASQLAGVAGRRMPKIAKENLKKVQAFLKFIGNPQDKLKIIHIAGTSGKGSVVAMLHNIFLSAGKNVGSYTSPHTTTFCERIKAGDKYISERELVQLTNFLKDKMDAFVRPTTYNLQPTTSLNFFEASFVLALLYFQKKKCEYAVIETGCGGRYDATNAVRKPVYTIITNIGSDHLDIIGPTLKDVAEEKAGIIKRGVPILTGERDKRWIEVFKKEVGLFHCSIVSLLKTINWKNLKNINVSLNGTEFEYEGEKYKLKFLGKHQAENAALAIECAKDLGVSLPAVKKGLAAAFYPARLEVISKVPLIIIDGAHNADKLKASFEFISNYDNNHDDDKKGKKYLIIAAAKSKRIKKIMPMLKSYFDVICATRFSNPFRKALDFGDWQRGFANKKILYYHYPHDALRAVLTKLRKYDLLLITGSIFLAGELREHWYPEEEIIKNRKSEF